MRLCGYAAMRLCGYAAMRLCGYAAMRLCGYAGRHSSKEILRIGMFRIPFSCGYYQYIENIHLARTKIILSCLFLLEAHGLEIVL